MKGRRRALPEKMQCPPAAKDLTCPFINGSCLRQKRGPYPKLTPSSLITALMGL